MPSTHLPSLACHLGNIKYFYIFTCSITGSTISNSYLMYITAYRGLLMVLKINYINFTDIYMYIYMYIYIWFNTLWPNDTIWWHISGLTLAQVMAWCLMAPSHYLNQCWLIISEVHLMRPISQEVPHPPITKSSLKITFVKFHPNLPGANELIHMVLPAIE